MKFKNEKASLDDLDVEPYDFVEGFRKKRDEFLRKDSVNCSGDAVMDWCEMPPYLAGNVFADYYSMNLMTLLDDLIRSGFELQNEILIIIDFAKNNRKEDIKSIKKSCAKGSDFLENPHLCMFYLHRSPQGIAYWMDIINKLKKAGN